MLCINLLWAKMAFFTVLLLFDGEIKTCYIIQCDAPSRPVLGHLPEHQYVALSCIWRRVKATWRQNGAQYDSAHSLRRWGGGGALCVQHNRPSLSFPFATPPLFPLTVLTNTPHCLLCENKSAVRYRECGTTARRRTLAGKAPGVDRGSRRHVSANTPTTTRQGALPTSSPMKFH